MSSAVYYPQHFRSTRPYLKSFSVGLDELIKERRLNPKTSQNLSGRSVAEAYGKEGVDITNAKFNTQGFSVESQAALMYGQWAHAGAPLFSFKTELTAALRATGVGEVSIGELHFPFDCAYFHFGPQPGLTLQSGAAVTGAYVMWTPGQALRLTLTAPLPPGATLCERWTELYDLRILASHFDENIELAIENALADDVEDIKQAARILANGSAERAEAGALATQMFLEAHDANKETLARSFQLLTNALCYLTAFPEDSSSGWQDSTPEKLRVKADTAPAKEAARALSKLNAMGYRKVQHVGTEFSKAAQNPDVGHMTPHWRRGHWRSQAHGPQMSLRKLIWLRPTRVLGAPASEEPRIYKTEKTGGKPR